MDARLVRCIALATMLPLLASCARLGYYSELARGQMQLLQAREPISEILADDQRDVELQGHLSRVLAARRFAVQTLLLPDNASYTRYADLGRDYALWNVLATPEFSLEPVTDCFPIAGCVAYRGHYREIEARKQAETFMHQGHDVVVSGVPAYSTLGWFADPVLNTMMHWRDIDLIGTVFHELAHQKLYVSNDSAFNESFASFVEQQGIKEYFGSPAENGSAVDKRRSQFIALILRTRDELESLYQRKLDPSAMRRKKAQKFSELREAYRVLRDEQWDGADAYGSWFAQPLNNASLLPFGLYDQWVPAFETLFEQADGDWQRFYTAAENLARLEHAPRRAQLQALMEVPAVP